MASNSPRPPEVSSRYQGLKLLGSGAVGAVYRAFDTLLGRPVAIKVLPAAETTSNEVECFKLEFQTVADLEHPNLVKVFDFGQTSSGGLFYSMELLPSGALDSLQLPLDEEALLSTAVQLCRALQYIHSKGIIHRDIKPANVLLADPPETDRMNVKLADFGLASLPKGAVSPSPTGGTPAYAAPEVFAQGAADSRADLFSLGVVLYELSTGKLPFSWRDGSIARIAPPTSLNENLRKETDTFILKLLEFDPSNRYRDANSVIEAINHLFGVKYAAETKSTGVSYVLSPALVGRSKELEAIKMELSALAKIPVPDEGAAQDATPKVGSAPAGGTATEPHAGVILISGTTGIGKTRLVQEAKLFCQLNGLLFCQGQSVTGSSMPGGPLTEAVRSLLSTMPAGKAPDPGPVLGPLIDSTQDMKQVEAADQSSFAESVYQVLRSASELYPTVLCLEDIQLADPHTLAAIGHLSRGFFLTTLGDPSFEAPLRMLITVDDSGSLTKEQKALLKELSAAPFVVQLKPQQLSADQVSLVVTSMFGPRALPEGAAERLHAATSGLPLFLQQLMAQLLHQGAMTQELGGWRLVLPDLESLPVPKGTKEWAETILAGLDLEERSIMEVTSVLTSPAGTEEISALAGLPYSRAKGILRELSRRALLTEKRGQFALSPGPLRNSTYGLLHWKKRRSLHLEAARLLEGKPMPPRARIHALAHHYLLAKNKEGALSWGLAAARDSARAQANSEAAKYYRELLGHELRPELRIEVLIEYGNALAGTGNPDEAIAVYKKALIAVHGRHQERSARLCRLLGETYQNRGDVPKARSFFKRALSAPRASKDDLALTLARTAILEHSVGRPAAADRYMSRALSVLDSHDVKKSVASSVTRMAGQILGERGRLDESTTLLRQSLQHATAAADLKAQSRAYASLGWIYHRLAQYGHLRRVASAGLILAAKTYDPISKGIYLMNIGGIDYRNGDYPTVTDYLLQASSLFRRANSTLLYTQCLMNLGLVLIERGLYENAFRYLERALVVQARHGLNVAQLGAQSVIVTGLIHTGRLQEAYDLARSCARQAEKAAVPHDVLMARKKLADLFWLFGEADRSRSLLEEVLSGFEKIDERDEVCECLARLATMEEVAGNLKAARAYSSRAMRLANSLKCKPLQLKALIATTPRGQNALARLRRLAGEVESPELRWRAFASCARYYVKTGRVSNAVEEYNNCLAVIRSVVADIRDKDLMGSYLTHPDRAAVFKAIENLNKSPGGNKAGLGSA